MLANVMTRASGVSRHPNLANVAHSQLGISSKHQLLQAPRIPAELPGELPSDG